MADCGEQAGKLPLALRRAPVQTSCRGLRGEHRQGNAPFPLPHLSPPTRARRCRRGGATPR